MNTEQKKLHIFSILAFAFLVCCFYILGGASHVEQQEYVEDSFNTTLPDANLVDLSENRLDAIYRAEEISSKQKRIDSRQNSSFRWLSDEDGDSSDLKLMVSSGEDTIEEANEQEEVERKSKRRKTLSGGLSDRELFEKQKQLAIEKKRRELELKLGLVHTTATADDIKESTPQNAEIVVGSRQNSGFYGLTTDETPYKAHIRALVHGDYRNIKTGAIVKFRIIDEFTIDGIHIPKNTFLYGQLSFSSNRAMIRIENIQYKNRVIPFRASIYDQDGFEGLYTPDNMTDEAKREVAKDVISSTNFNISTGIPIVNTAANAVTAAVKSISQSAVKEKKLNISSNYQVNIRYE